MRGAQLQKNLMTGKGKPKLTPNGTMHPDTMFIRRNAHGVSGCSDSPAGTMDWMDAMSLDNAVEIAEYKLVRVRTFKLLMEDV